MGCTEAGAKYLACELKTGEIVAWSLQGAGKVSQRLIPGIHL